MLFQADQLLRLLQWTDSAFPTGAFAHSGGLETYTQANIVRAPDDLAALIAVRLEAAASTDMLIVQTVMGAVHADDWALIAHCDALCSASKIARESREASEKIGRRMLASVLNVLEDARLRRYQAMLAPSGPCAGHHAVVHGLACAASGIEARAGLLAFAYALVANQTAASLKVMAIGQTQAQAVLGAAGPAMQAAADAALAHSLDEFGSFTPGLDIRAMQHEGLFQRLFIS
ncbi:MAG: hypothetical protein KME04_11945 [Pleurocapsa minor GSE-CHR-MK-17-07R]|jgi:urease accessory protein|nr:hypothetical protein [Pleurocapsa minor GSE-CHR-MK 17-07R]